MSKPDLFHQINGNRVRWRGRTLLYFAGCDYFRMAHHPAVIDAASQAARRLCLNVAASRLTTGSREIHETLEEELARYFRAKDALLLPTGYLTSTVVAQALAGDFGAVLLDERSHPALQDAALHFGCPIRTFRHRDPENLQRVMGRVQRRGRLVLLTDGMFALDGAVAPLRDYLGCLPADALLLVDDAHGAGLLGVNGRGTPEHDRVPRHRLVQCVTLSKAFGVYGGAVIGTRGLRRKVMARSRAFVGCTAMPPPLAAAALCSIRLMGQRGKAMRLRLSRNADFVKASLRGLGYEIPEYSGPIIAVRPQNANETRRLKARLLEAGIHPPFLRYAGVPNGLFRFVISSEHTRPQLDQLVAALARFKGAGRSGDGKGSGRTTGGAGRRPATPGGRRHR